MKFYLTTPIYYVNAKPHIGSAYTTIAADVLARFYKQQGSDVHLLTGTAEHGLKMAQSAAAAGLAPQTFVDQQSEYFKTAWAALNIEYSDFIRTTEPRHAAAVLKFFENLKDSGQIYQAPYTGLYCVGHEAFIKESELDPQGLCPDHQTAPEKITENNWFFRLSTYGEKLHQLISTDELLIQPAARKNEVLSFIAQGLEDISISRQNVDWALPLPWDKNQTIYVWLDELFNYCSAIGYGAAEEKFKKLWPADLHLVGKDIIKFHCIIWPALLLAIGEKPPRRVFAHGFFTVNGQKMSKSLGNVIDPVALVEEYSADAVRYLLLRTVPFGADGDISLDKLHERYNADLANGLGNLVSRTLNMFEKFWPDFSPPAGGGVTHVVSRGGGSFHTHLHNLAFDQALAIMWQQIAAADALIETTKPWALAKAGETAQLQQVLTTLFTTLRSLQVELAPFMPATSATLANLLANRPLRKPATPLFARKS
jgi:methionyl-tRNA synthetase